MKHVLVVTDDECVILHNAVLQWMDQIKDTAMWHEDPEPTEELADLQALADSFLDPDPSRLLALP